MDADIEQMFGGVCSVGGCHSAADQAAGLDLESDNLRERLLTHESAECGPLIVPGNGADSLLVSILAPNPECGPTMPPTLPLVPEDLQCVSSWIDAMSASGP